jgi:sec-independent protein translocase protein TatA
MFGLGGQEILLLLVLGVLLFGRKLPELGRSVGKTMVEFKKGMRGIEDEVSESPQQARAAIEPEPVKPPQRVTPAAAPRFEDAPAAPANVPPKV